MIINLLTGITGCLIGIVICYSALKKQLKQKQKLDIELVEQNATLKESINSKIEKEKLIEQKLEEKIFSIDRLAEERENNLLEQFKLKKENIERFITEANQEYETILKDLADQAHSSINNSVESINYYKTLQDIIIEKHKKEIEDLEKDKFYMIQLEEASTEDIKILKNIIPNLHNKEIINKLIWKTYYEKPTGDMLGRIIGNRVITGIYKITNVENKMCYIGQAVNIKKRFITHIKRGLGAEPRTQNKFYPILGKIGVENFKFEILQECKEDDLDKLEAFWIDYYQAKDFGYVMRKN